MNVNEEIRKEIDDGSRANKYSFDGIEDHLKLPKNSVEMTRKVFNSVVEEKNKLITQFIKIFESNTFIQPICFHALNKIREIQKLEICVKIIEEETK
jgi:hypothetical protein